jgi:hypothetical protein
MTDIELTGSLEGLTELDVSDLERYKRAVADGEQLGFAYYFPSMLAYNRSGRRAALLCEDDGSVCVFRWTADSDSVPRLDVLLAPSPMNPAVLQRCLERANEYNGDQSARVLKVDAKDAEIIGAMAGMSIKERRSQYLYAPDSFADISGRKYRTMRRNMSKVKALENVEVLAYTEAHTEPCMQLLQRWRAHHRETHGTMGGVGTTRRIIDLAGRFAAPDIHGEVITIDNKLVGFAFGGEIRPGVGAFLEAKCDFNIQGLSYFQRYSFISKLQHFDVVNDGSDVGREGLRQLKTSLRPVGMHTEFRGLQKAS